MRMSLVKTNTSIMKRKRTVLVYTVKNTKRNPSKIIAKVRGVFKNLKHLKRETGLNLDPRDGTFVTMNVYECESDLPENIGKWVRPRLPVPRSKEDLSNTEFVYAVLQNTEMCEGDGINYIWMLTSNEALANKVAVGNGVSGSDADVVKIRLNTRINPRYPRYPTRFYVHRKK